MTCLKADRNTYVPLQEYEDLLNYCSQTYGTPLSSNALTEGALFDYLSTFYKEVLEGLTFDISKGVRRTNPNARKYSFSQFLKEYMKVSKEYCVNYRTGRYSYAEDVRAKIDLYQPNFMNSLGKLWSDIDSNKGICTYLPHMVYVDNQVDVNGDPLYVLKPRYSRKEGATHRINTSEPNIQSLKKQHRREFLVPREGFTFVQADISGQDPAVFFNGLCRDEDIIKGFYEVGEYYLPVVSKVAGIPMDEVDTELRNSYKIGILSLMNGKTVNNLAVDMGSMQHASDLIEFVNSNPMYRKFIASAQRELKTRRPVAKSLVGDLTREIKETGWRGLNQMKNSPIQMTGIALFSISIYAFYSKLNELYPDFVDKQFGEVLEFVRPVLHLHDEVLLEVRNIPDLPEASAEALKWALEIQFEDWAPMRAEPLISERYCL